MPIDVKELRRDFQELYGCEPRCFRAPGRVNLIGEHTDYNGGFVLPMAIERETVVAAAKRADRKIRVRSANLNESAEIDLGRPEQKLRASWVDFIEGMARILGRDGSMITGADLLLLSDVPTGAGLSSSAALEISVGLALAKISGHDVDPIELAKAGQSAEHEFVGANVGIMDQYISALGKAGNALLIDCRSLEAEQVPFASENTTVVMCNTNVDHELASSEYNNRRRECEEGVEILKRRLPRIEQLRDVSSSDLQKYGAELPPVIKRRCRHVVTENERTLLAAEALKRDDLSKFGRLMRLSHESLRYDYEVSCRELDLLVEIADGCKGVLGARMTGGGFGGCTVNLVLNNDVDEFTDAVSREYEPATGLGPTIYFSKPADGASEILS